MWCGIEEVRKQFHIVGNCLVRIDLWDNEWNKLGVRNEQHIWHKEFLRISFHIWDEHKLGGKQQGKKDHHIANGMLDGIVLQKQEKLKQAALLQIRTSFLCMVK